MSEWYEARRAEEITEIQAHAMFTVEDIAAAFAIARGGLKRNQTKSDRFYVVRSLKSATSRAKIESGEHWRPGPRGEKNMITYDRAHVAAILDVLMGIATNPGQSISGRAANRGMGPEEVSTAEVILLGNASERS